MGKKGKKGQAGKPKNLTPKDTSKRLNALVKNLEEELKGADLFAPLPSTEDCPICLVPLSRLPENSGYRGCCGKWICTACDAENKALIKKQNEENAAKSKPGTCPFCRTHTHSSDLGSQLEARALKNDHVAFYNLGICFTKGICGLPKDDLKALDCWIKAVELGSSNACVSIAGFYSSGRGVSKDLEREHTFNTIGALRGSIIARHGVAFGEYKSGNHEIGIRHWKIAAEAGSQLALDLLKKIYNADGKLPGKEFISKECMDSIYRVCHDAQKEVKSEAREKHFTNVDMKC